MNLWDIHFGNLLRIIWAYYPDISFGNMGGR